MVSSDLWHLAHSLSGCPVSSPDLVALALRRNITAANFLGMLEMYGSTEGCDFIDIIPCIFVDFWDWSLNVLVILLRILFLRIFFHLGLESCSMVDMEGKLYSINLFDICCTQVFGFLIRLCTVMTLLMMLSDVKALWRYSSCFWSMTYDTGWIAVSAWMARFEVEVGVFNILLSFDEAK